MMYKRISSLLFCFLPAIYVNGSNDSLYISARTYTATRTEHIPRIDGLLNDSCWQEGEWAADFVQQQPYEGQSPSFPSEIKILYNSSYLFVAIRCHDGEPEKMRRIFGSRDAFTGDMTGIAIDSYNDDKTAFEFNLSSAGQKVDLKHKGNFEFDLNWNAVWNGKTALEDSAWTAEMQIPFSQLRYAKHEEHIWGMHIWRWLDRKSEESQWKLIPVNSPAMVYLFGELNGIKDIRSSRQVELLPYGLLKYSPQSDNDQNPYGDTKELFPSLGFDAKIGISSNFTLDVTINPDFGQVEADPSVLNLTAFETFYEEKRPFFLEGNEIFDFSLDQDMIYYSRRSGQVPNFIPEIAGEHYMQTPDNSTILGAAKITGKTSDGLSIGIMESMTSGEYSTIYFPENIQKDTLVNPYTNYLVARVMQEKNNANTIFGGIFTATHKIGSDQRIQSISNSAAYSGGLDFEQNFKNKTYFIGGKILLSHVNGTREAIQNIQKSYVHLYQRPDAHHLFDRRDTTLTSLTGTGGQLSAGKKGGKWRYDEKLQWRSPGFDLNDIGYLKQADFMAQTTELTFRENDPKKYSRNYLISFYQSTSLSFGGELVNSSAGVDLENQFHNLWGVQFNWNSSFPSFETRELRGGPALKMNAKNEFASHFNSNYAKDFYFNGGIHYTVFSDEPSRTHFAHIQFNWHPISRINLSPFVSYTDNINEFQYVQTIDTTTEIRYLMGRLEQKTLEFTFRAELFLTPEISLQFYGSPFYSSGHYATFYFVNKADAKRTEERYNLIAENTIVRNNETSNVIVTESTSGNSYSFKDPDFVFGQFRSNLVFRWEYKLGSVLYLVWSHNKTFDENIPFPHLSDSIENLRGMKGKNIFLVKLNFWFSI